MLLAGKIHVFTAWPVTLCGLVSDMHRAQFMDLYAIHMYLISFFVLI